MEPTCQRPSTRTRPFARISAGSKLMKAWNSSHPPTEPNGWARLCAEAADGQVLASATLLGRLPAGCRSKRIGTLELKGLHRPVETHEILDLDGR